VEAAEPVANLIGVRLGPDGGERAAPTDCSPATWTRIEGIRRSTGQIADTIGTSMKRRTFSLQARPSLRASLLKLFTPCRLPRLWRGFFISLPCVTWSGTRRSPAELPPRRTLFIFGTEP